MRFALASILVLAASQPAAADSASAARAAIAQQVQQQLRSNPAGHSQADIYMAITPVEVDGDAVPDWQVHWKDLGAGWCGTGGCRFQLWLGRAKGAPKLIFDRQMRKLTIEQRDGRPVFVFDFHGSECSGFGSQACPGEFAWDARAKALVLLPAPARHTAVESPLVFGR
jgi:hypothetical protein